MSLIDDLLEKRKLKYEDLNPEEKETMMSWIDAIQKTAVSVESLRDYILNLKRAVERQISKESSFNRIFIFKVENPKLIRLQARLRNYLLLEAFLSTSGEAQKELEQMLDGMTSA